MDIYSHGWVSVLNGITRVGNAVYDFPFIWNLLVRKTIVCVTYQ